MCVRLTVVFTGAFSDLKKKKKSASKFSEEKISQVGPFPEREGKNLIFSSYKCVFSEENRWCRLKGERFELRSRKSFQNRGEK